MLNLHMHYNLHVLSFDTTLICEGELESQQLGLNFMISSMRGNGFSFLNPTYLFSIFMAGAIQCLFHQRPLCIPLFLNYPSFEIHLLQEPYYRYTIMALNDMASVPITCHITDDTGVMTAQTHSFPYPHLGFIPSYFHPHYIIFHTVRIVLKFLV